MNALSAALALAQRGLAVFPCVLTKRPACSHGFKDATSDPAGVRELWRRFPGELVGVPTGNRNKFAALDVDPRHGGQEGDLMPDSGMPLYRVAAALVTAVTGEDIEAEGVRFRVKDWIKRNPSVGWVDWPDRGACARIHPRTLGRHIKAGSGPRVIRIGRRVLIREDDPMAWLECCASSDTGDQAVRPHQENRDREEDQPRLRRQHTAPDTARSRHRGHSLWSTAGGCRTTEAAETLARGVGGAHDLFDIRGRDTVPGCSRQYGVFP